MITERQQVIYNTYQHSTRTIKNNPYRPRKNFDNLDSTTTLLLQKLDSFFSNNKTVSYRDFFIAPYIIYGKDDYFDLNFFTTRKALKCYTEYVKKRETDNPDSEQVIENCKLACKFIYNYCKVNNISLKDYRVINDGNIPVVLQHLKEHKINFYTLCGLNIDQTLQTLPAELVNFIVDDFFHTLSITRDKFIKSSKLKNVVRQALQIIETKLLQINKPILN